MQTNSFINALRRTWVWPEFGQIRGFCRIESSRSTTTSSQHKRPSSEFHKNLSLFAKRICSLIRCCASINVGLQNADVLYGNAAPAPPSLPALSAASLRRLRVSAVLLHASRRCFALASMHLRIDTFHSCARPYRHIHRMTSKRLLPLPLRRRPGPPPAHRRRRCSAAVREEERTDVRQVLGG